MRAWAEWRIPLALVQPETVIASHRKGCLLWWRWKSTRAASFAATSSITTDHARTWGLTRMRRMGVPSRRLRWDR